MQKIYCHVDESGQDTEGKFFVVAVVITDTDRDESEKQLEGIEKTSGKGKVKWQEAKRKDKREYIRSVLQSKNFDGRLYYSVFYNTKEYVTCTVVTIAHAILAHIIGEYKATVLIDGLPKPMINTIATRLRQLEIKTEKVRPVRKEEADALLRLADAVAGFTRAAISDEPDLLPLIEKAKAKGTLREL